MLVLVSCDMLHFNNNNNNNILFSFWVTCLFDIFALNLVIVNKIVLNLLVIVHIFIVLYVDEGGAFQ